ncbi:hypothetical protein H2200_010560 [Cladophialophora chaetospira]|uniref:Uncharacterized protein n=1 Tax=Cladophialophora chaetospira TaxID=386627 RepID=A0AA38X1T6_9EURO|nr:hypothetical protein H2200_010560 [Cladophialophora chaetospira]
MSSTTETPVSLNKSIKFILYVRVHIPVKDHPEFFKYFNPAMDKVLAEEACRFFFVQKQHPDSPGYDPEVISFVEGWDMDTDEFLDVQMSKFYYEPYRSETAKLYSKPLEFEFWTPEEGKYQVKLPAAA